MDIDDALAGFGAIRRHADLDGMEERVLARIASARERPAMATGLLTSAALALTLGVASNALPGGARPSHDPLGMSSLAPSTLLLDRK